jgi:hypothetical protein
MGCCRDEGGDALFCERRAMGKWHCKEAEEVVKSWVLETLWKTGELTKEEEKC